MCCYRGIRIVLAWELSRFNDNPLPPEDGKMESTEQESEGNLWAKYLHALTQEGIPEERIRYYIGWVESFRRFQKSRSPEGLGPEDAQDFLRALSERPRIQLWQVRQAVHALKVFYRGVLGAEWCEQWETPAIRPGIKRASLSLRTQTSSRRGILRCPPSRILIIRIPQRYPTAVRKDGRAA
jgi:hypothetical protein